MSSPGMTEDPGADTGPEMDSFLLESAPPSPPLSYLSMKSEEDQPVEYEEEEEEEEYVFTPESRGAECGSVFPTDLFESESMVPEPEGNFPRMEMGFIFKSMLKALRQLSEDELSLFKRYMSCKYSQYFEDQMEDLDVLDVVDKMVERCGTGLAAKVALHVLKEMKKSDLVSSLKEQCCGVVLQYDLKKYLKWKNNVVYEGLARQGVQSILKDIHTDVLLTVGGHGEVNDEHETASGGQPRPELSRPEAALTPSDLFEPSFVHERPIRTVMTRGIAGIGLTVSVRKFIMDWIEGKANQDIHFVFPIPVRELNLPKKKEESLIEYLSCLYPGIKDVDFIDSPECKVLFILDGLDQYRHTSSFRTNGSWTDPNAPTSSDMLLTNLIRGNLFPSCRVWITTRSAASGVVPADWVDLMTQVHGFTDSQKERYFRKKICDQDRARQILARVESSKSLHIMCHVPLFSWAVLTVFEEGVCVGATPPITTELFMHYVQLQTHVMHVKYQGLCSSRQEWTEADRAFLMKLGKLAFQLLEKGKKEFHLGDLKDCGLDVKQAVVQSGLCTELFSPQARSQRRVFSFVHLSVQEYLAAYYVYMSFKVNRKSVLDQARFGLRSKLSREPALVNLLCGAVDKALQSQNGHLDLFLRFLLGLSVDSIQRLFRPSVRHPESSARSIEETLGYIRKKIAENASPERCRNLHLCLTELEG